MVKVLCVKGQGSRLGAYVKSGSRLGFVLRVVWSCCGSGGSAARLVVVVVGESGRCWLWVSVLSWWACDRDLLADCGVCDLGRVGLGSRAGKLRDKLSRFQGVQFGKFG